MVARRFTEMAYAPSNIATACREPRHGRYRGCDRSTPSGGPAVETRTVQLGDQDHAPILDAPADAGTPPPFLYLDPSRRELTSGRGDLYVRGGHRPEVDADPWVYYKAGIR
jgi:hypothetical protein